MNDVEEKLTQRWDRGTPRPKVGSKWIWEPIGDEILVDRVEWNGEEWWVYVRRVGETRTWPNEAARFWEAVLPYDE